MITNKIKNNITMSACASRADEMYRAENRRRCAVYVGAEKIFFLLFFTSTYIPTFTKISHGGKNEFCTRVVYNSSRVYVYTVHCASALSSEDAGTVGTVHVIAVYVQDTRAPRE